MQHFFNYLTKACLCASLFVGAISCSDKDEFFDKDKDKTEKTAANTFDFSTTQEIDLLVDYSSFNAKIPVFFSVYNVNPFVNENTIGEYIDENIRPIFSGYTEPNGKFDETVTLPRYAKVLYIVTGNFLVGLRKDLVEIVNGEAKAIINNPMATKTRAMRVAGAGTSTNDLSQMQHLWKKSSTQVFKPWVTPLGTWNSASGRPDYLLNTSDPVAIAKGLVFSEEEITGMFGTACDALNSGTSLKEQYRAAADLKLVHDSEVSITALGSSTCWNSSMGYYYYDQNNPPQSKLDLNVIMLFPNTQDGQWPRGSYPNNDYNGNIGTLRGDVVQLMYYPPKADGSLDLNNGTKVFPAGTKIGFMLKTNAWGQRGKDYAVNGKTTSSYYAKKNIWASTTDGFSYAPDGGKCPNPDDEARSAKFAYTAPNGSHYVVVSFEDACDDKDYDDLMFALNPANAFDFNDVAQIESRRATVEGVYGFEDKWPEDGDYDMNDLMIDCKHELEWYTHEDGSKKLNKERFYLTTYHNYITLKDGLAVDLQASDIATLYVNKILPGQTKYASENYTMVNKMYYYTGISRWGGKDSPAESRMWYLTDDITKDEDKATGEGVTWVFEVTYTKAVSKGQCTIRPFLWRKLSDNKQLEVHLPWNSPTGKADTSLFGTKADKSDPSVTRSNGQKMYYVGAGTFPFAFYLEGTSIDVFRETILKRDNESKRIDVFFPDFLEWSISDGKKNSDWYLKHLDSEVVGVTQQ